MEEKNRTINKDEGEDVEGHVNVPHTKLHNDEGEDVEGHAAKSHVKAHPDEGEDNDVEGHSFKYNQKL